MINEEEANEIEKTEESKETQEAQDEMEIEERGEEKKEELELLRDLESIREEVDKKADKADFEEIKGWKANILSKLSNFQEELENLKKEDERILMNFREFTDIITKKNEEIMAIVKQKVDEEKLAQFRKDMSKMDKKLNLVMEETGFGEILDVGKIPPNILEIVYDTTLKDVTNAIWQEYGPSAEKIIMDILEDIRMETSGSEMFYFDGRRIRTRDVAKNIKRGMISARQLQDTYEELLRKLIERVPGHKSKNFRAMIKLKSQEYTVDKTTFLLGRVEKIENTVMMLNGMVSGLANNMNNETARIRKEIAGLSKEIESRMSEMEKRMDAEMNALREKNENMMERFREDMVKRISDMENQMMKRIEEIKNPESKEEKEVLELKPKDLNEEERFVYSAIPSEGITLGKLKKITGNMIEHPLEEILERLLKSSLIYEKKKGKTVRYYLQTEEKETPKEEQKETEAEKKKEKEHKEKKTKEKKSKPRRKKKEEKETLDARHHLILNAIPENGCTLNRLRKSLEKEIGYEELLDMVKELVEKEYLVVTTRGRYTIYMKNEEKIKEIGGEKDA